MDTLKKLKGIEKRLEEISKQMQREEREFREEQAARERKGLTGKEAIQHYNEWMRKAGLDYLVIEYKAIG